jgi:dipeptidyl aminopeptidase/acylaminoacyl peptidase
VSPPLAATLPPASPAPPSLSSNAAVDALLRMPRLETFALSSDGTCAYTIVNALSPTGDGLVGSLWRIDLRDLDRPAAQPVAERLDVGGPLAVLDDGVVVAVARLRDAPAGDPTGLWLIDPDGTEPTCVLQATGGIEGCSVAPASGAVALALAVLPDAEDLAESERRVALARERGADARRYTGYPVRHWNRWLGPLHPRVFLLEDVRVPTPLERLVPIELGDPERLDDHGFALSPDARTLVASRRGDPDALLQTPDELIRVDLASGEQRVLAAGAYQYAEISVSPDSRQAVAVRTSLRTRAGAENITLWLADLDGGEGRDLTPQLDAWPAQPSWAPDGAHVLFTAWLRGQRPVFSVPVGAGAEAATSRLTGEGDFMGPRALPGSDRVVAIHSSPVHPPTLATVAADGGVRQLTEADVPAPLRVRMEELTVTVDGVPVRSALILPEGERDEPLPLLVHVHGGPQECYSSWLWGLNAAAFAAAGFAVLQPDPAATPGYGQAFVDRGWGRWDVVQRDVLATIDGAVARPDVDGERVVVLGASFGGLMVNLLLGATDRFRAGVSHAGIWDWVQYHGSSDIGRSFMLGQFGDPYLDPQPLLDVSPLALGGDYSTPLLITHGEKDYRVPIDQALKGWTALRAGDAPAELLVFPGEDHHINGPANSALWYDAALEFLTRGVAHRT